MWFNQLKTVILLASLSGILMLIGGFVGGAKGITIAVIMSLVMNVVAYFFSDKIVLHMYNAKPLDTMQYGWVRDIVKELTQKQGLPMPTLWIVQTPMANAFATGRNPNHAAVAVTTGILDILDRNELRGVLAHEISHIKNRDILISTVAATMATAISYLGNMMQFMSFSRTGGDSSQGRRSANPIVLLVMAILMPMAATLIQLAISRSREYLADESGAELSHDPLALASALEKLQANIKYAHLGNTDTARASTAHLFIVNPFTAQGLVALFQTHPPMIQRVSRLRALYEKMMHKQ